MDSVGVQMVQLYCNEVSSSPATFAVARQSFADPALRDDDRVLQSMLQDEDGQQPATSRHVVYSQGDLQPKMRHTVISWMLEVRIIVVVVVVVA